VQAIRTHPLLPHQHAWTLLAQHHPWLRAIGPALPLLRHIRLHHAASLTLLRWSEALLQMRKDLAVVLSGTHVAENRRTRLSNHRSRCERSEMILTIRHARNLVRMSSGLWLAVAVRNLKAARTLIHRLATVMRD